MSRLFGFVPGSLRSRRSLLRVARRSLRNSPGRNALIVLLLSLVVAVGVVMGTAARTTWTSADDIDTAWYGSGDTRVTFGPEARSWNQPRGLAGNGFSVEARYDPAADATWHASFDADRVTRELEAELGSPILLSRSAHAQRTDLREYSMEGNFTRGPGATISDMDPAQPLATGMMHLIEGRFPQERDEIAVNHDSSWVFGKNEIELGTTFETNGRTLTVTGVFVMSSSHDDVILLTPATFDALGLGVPAPEGSDRFYDGPDYQFIASVGEGLALNEHLPKIEMIVGRSIFPGVARTATDFSTGNPQIVEGESWDLSYNSDPSPALVSVLAAAVPGVVIAILAAGAFAVGTRRRTHELARLATTGADTRHLRRLIQYESLWLAALAAVVGVALGISAAWLLFRSGTLPNLGDRYPSSFRFSPIDWLIPAAICVAASMQAALFATRFLSDFSPISTLAGSGPVSPARPLSVRAGVASLGVIGGGAVLVILLAGDAQYRLGMEHALAVGLLLLFMVSGLALVGNALIAFVARRADNLPLLARLVVRDSARDSGRSAMTIGAFVAVLSIPLVIGASAKALPERVFQPPTEFDRRVLLAEPGATGEFENTSIEFNETIESYMIERDRILDENVGPNTAVPIRGFHDLWVDTDNRLASTLLAIIATPELVDELGIDQRLVDELDSESALLISSGRVRDGQQTFPEESAAVVRPSGFGDSIAITIRRGPSVLAFAEVLLVSESFSEHFREAPNDIGTLFVLDDELTPSALNDLDPKLRQLWAETFGSLELNNAEKNVSRNVGVAVNIVPTFEEAGSARWATIIVSAVVAAVLALVMAALSATELDRPLSSMVASGAAPAIRRKMLAAQTLYHLIIAAPIAIVMSLVIFCAAWTIQSGQLQGLTVPWISILLTTIVLPLVVAGMVGLLFRNAKPAVSRRIG